MEDEVVLGLLRSIGEAIPIYPAILYHEGYGISKVVLEHDGEMTFNYLVHLGVEGCRAEMDGMVQNMIRELNGVGVTIYGDLDALEIGEVDNLIGEVFSEEG